VAALRPDAAARRRRSAPRPLVLLLLAVTALGLAWNFVTPANQAPDEFAHIGYVQYFAETGDLPGGDPKAAGLSTEMLRALDASNGLRAPATPGVDLTWDARAFDTWRAAAARAPDAVRSDGGGPNPASSNPPLYYLTAAPAYLLGSSGDLFTRIALIRLVSLLWLLGAVVGAWLLAGEVFRRDRVLQTTAAGVVGLTPMAQLVGNSVNPDPAVFATWAFALWLGVRLLRRGLTPARAGALFLVVGLACVAKATSYALVPAAVVALGIAAWRVRPVGRRRAAADAGADAATDETASTEADAVPATASDASSTAPSPAGATDPTRVGGTQPDAPAPRAAAAARAPRRTVVASVALAVLGLVVTFGTWILVSRLSGTATAAQAAEVTGTPISITGLATYVWQFYLPILPFMDPVPGAARLPVYDVLVQGAWGRFGWLEVSFPGWAYALMGAATALVAVLAAAGAWVDRRRIDLGVAVFLGLVVLALMAGLHVTEYQKGGTGFIQGRYVLPVAPLAGLAVARALRWLPARRVAQGAGIVLAVLVVLNLFALGIVLERFYA
jgi:hypothetical protein